jgi:hypothetical protein
MRFRAFAALIVIVVVVAGCGGILGDRNKSARCGDGTTDTATDCGLLCNKNHGVVEFLNGCRWTD